MVSIKLSKLLLILPSINKSSFVHAKDTNNVFLLCALTFFKIYVFMCF